MNNIFRISFVILCFLTLITGCPEYQHPEVDKTSDVVKPDEPVKPVDDVKPVNEKDSNIEAEGIFNLSLQQELKKMTKEIPANSVFVVYPAEYKNAYKTEISTSLANEMTKVLVGLNITVVERSNLSIIFEEMSKVLDSRFDQANAIELGRHLTATHMLLSTLKPITVEKNIYQLDMNIVEVQTGKKSTVSDISNFKLPEKFATLLDKTAKPAKTFDFELSVFGETEKNNEIVFKDFISESTLKNGDALRIKFKASQSAYVYMIWVGNSGKVMLLFPKLVLPGFAEINVMLPVIAGDEYNIPQGADDLLQVGSGETVKSSQEKLIIIASPEKSFGDYSDDIETVVGSTFQKLENGENIELEGHQNLTVKLQKVSELTLLKKQVHELILSGNVSTKDITGITQSRLETLKTKRTAGEAKTLCWKNSEFIIHQINFSH